MRMISAFLMITFFVLLFYFGAIRADGNDIFEEKVDLKDLKRGGDNAYFVPRHRGGDRDFYNHIEVKIKTTLRIADNDRDLEAQVYMYANEGRGDRTRAFGESEWEKVYDAPPGHEIRGIYDNEEDKYKKEIEDKFEGLLTNSCCEPIKESGNNFVRYYKIWGDFNGGESGSRTGVSVLFNRVYIELKRRR